MPLKRCSCNVKTIGTNVNSQTEAVTFPTAAINLPDLTKQINYRKKHDIHQQSPTKAAQSDEHA
jgi:hypothetical protein